MMDTEHRSRSFSLFSAVVLFFLPTGIWANGREANEYLEMDLQQLMNITVTSVAKKEQRLSDTAAAVFVITQEDIHRSGVTTLADALALAPGLQVAKISASKWSVSSRGFAGFTSNKLLVLLDGRSVYSPAYSGTFWDAQHTLLEDIDRIEVIRGPGGTLWGANAVNGVINIITKKSQDTQGTLVRVGGGTQDPFMGGARYGTQLGAHTYGRAYLSYDRHGSNQLEENSSDADDDWQPLQGGFRLDGEGQGQQEWTLQGDLYRNTGDQITSPYWTSTPPYQTVLYDELHSEGGNLLGRWRKQWADNRALTLKSYYDYSSRDEKIYSWQYNTLDVDLQYEMPLGERQALTMGVGYRAIKGDFDQTFQVYLPDHSDNLYSGFFQDELSLTQSGNLKFTLGSKYEHNDYTGDEWQPSARLLWKPAAQHSLWTSVARAVRTPSLMEHYGRVVMGVIPQGQQVSTIAFVGDESFDSELLYAYEAGYRWQARQNLSVDVALFYNDYDEIYTVSPTVSATGYDYHFVNALEGSSCGVELAIDWKATSALSFLFTYAYLNLDLSAVDGAASSSGGSLLEESSPHHQAGLRVSYALSEQWQLNLWGRYVDSIVGRSRADLLGTTVPVDAYFLLDANIVWKPTRQLEFMLAGQNLANSGQLEYLSEYQTPATEIERGVYGKLTWRF